MLRPAKQSIPKATNCGYSSELFPKCSTRATHFAVFPVFLVHLLLALLALSALILQLITPVVLNIPLIAFCLTILLLTVWSFRRARRQKKFPIVATTALGVQSILFLLSIAILAVVTIPHESAEDSPAVVQGIRNFLISRGLIETPKTAPRPQVVPASEEKPPETVNAPDAAKVDIKIE